MKRLFALAMAAMMSCSLFVSTSFAVKSPELERGVVISKEVAGTAADNYEDIEFNFELDVSKLKFKDNRWEAFAKKEGITYDPERDVLRFSLKAGEKIKLDLPFGDEYSVTEIGGYDSEDYVSTTVNGEESMGHTFDVSKKDKDYDKVEFINTYDEPQTEEPEPPVDPDDPDDPGPGQPNTPSSDEPGAEKPGTPDSDEPAGEKPVSPQTGYPVGILALTAAAAASGAVAVAAGKKAKKD